MFAFLIIVSLYLNYNDTKIYRNIDIVNEDVIFYRNFDQNKMQSSINQRIIDLIQEKTGGSQSLFEKKTGIPQSTLSSIIGKRQTQPSYDILLKIANAFEDVNMNYLIRGHNLSGDSYAEVIETTVTESAKGNIYYITSEQVRAGALSGYSDRFEYIKLYIPGFDTGEEKYLIQVYGDSMYPFISSGDMVICKKVDHSKLRTGQPYIIATIEEGIVVKRLKSVEDGMLTVESDNPKYGPYQISKAEVQGIYQIIGAVTFNTGERIIIQKLLA